MAKNYHLCISVTGVLRNWSDSLYTNCVTDETGRTLEPWEVKAMFVQAAAEGKRVLPMDPSCDNFDYAKGCQGHEQAAH